VKDDEHYVVTQKEQKVRRKSPAGRQRTSLQSVHRSSYFTASRDPRLCLVGHGCLGRRRSDLTRTAISVDDRRTGQIRQQTQNRAEPNDCRSHPDWRSQTTRFRRRSFPRSTANVGDRL